jgi:aminomethyltransferase
MAVIQYRHSPLQDRQRDAGARFVGFGDWEVADSFGAPDSEYEALVNAAGVADLCHRGRFKLEGDDARACLQKLTTTDLTRVEINTEVGAFVLNERGGIIDEVDLFRSDRFWSIRCSSLRKDRMQAVLSDTARECRDVTLTDATTTQGSLLVAGPLAQHVMEDGIMDGKVPREEGASSILQIGQGRCLVTRRTFGALPCYQIDTGGLFLESVWERLGNLARRREGCPVGMRALEMVRIEAGVPRVGAEIDEETTPIEIGAMLRVAYSKGDFVGRTALLHSTCREFTRRMVYLRIDSFDVPHPGDTIETDGVPIGHVTSAAPSPRLKCALALGFVDSFRTAQNTVLTIRNQQNQTLLASVTDPSAMRTATS